MGTTTKTLYESDFVEWADTMAALLRAGRLSEIDVENVAEEIEGLGRAERKAARSQLQRLMMHLLKQKIEPERDSGSWRASIQNARDEIIDDFEEAASLKQHLEQSMERVYRRAGSEALRETELKHHQAISERCPWKLDELLTGDFVELARR